MASSDAVSYIALQYAMASLSAGEGGGGGSTRGTVKVQVAETITGQPRTQADVVNLGTEQEVLLQFTIPQGISGSQWYISDLEKGSPVEGAVNGDMILYTSGDIYKVVDGVPVDQGLNIGQKEEPKTPSNPYEYAVSVGFIGTKDEFDIRFLAALSGGPTNTALNSGVANSATEQFILDGGIADSDDALFGIDGNMYHQN